jgi:hypothetical protein
MRSTRWRDWRVGGSRIISRRRRLPITPLRTGPGEAFSAEPGREGCTPLCDLHVLESRLGLAALHAHELPGRVIDEY